ncbi:hypothetical protein [Phaeocystidibacter luteus]|uniref:DUF4375 domain-containing protein n=1 Tax=Phaeocystidibacter luteus TaxID=911197 RepID=A0A6N6RDU2_9FLAO|nr:hypothetical protein [Phaeocystidibacter luteus]KAB2807698.1 hypothetical protein F8C67_11700 [Phaeocystidibacter luteus]
MKDGYQFITQPDGTSREIDWEELNQLKKDILWLYDENFGEKYGVFVPEYSFRSNYWEYLTLNGDKWFQEDEKAFYRTGCLIILLYFCIEYIDIEAGNQRVFERSTLPEIISYVNGFQPNTEIEKSIKEKVLLGLEISLSMTPENLRDSDFEHERTAEFYNGSHELTDRVIRKYYEEILRK